MTAESALAEITARLVANFSPLQIVLFGSHARGNPTRDSDLDLLIVVDEGLERRKTTAAMYQSLRGIAFPSDLVVVTPSYVEASRDEPGGVVRHALREGRVVFERGQAAA